MQRFRSVFAVFSLFFWASALWATEAASDADHVLETEIAAPQCSADLAHSTHEGISTPCEPYLCDTLSGLCMSTCDAASDCADDYICDIDCDTQVGQCRMPDDLTITDDDEL